MRSLLFAGATRPDLVRKLARAAPDGAVIDLEDAVPADHKDQARDAAIELARELMADHPQLDVYIRVNAIGTRWGAADIAATSGMAVGVVLPKLEEPVQLQVVRELIGDSPRRLVVGIESMIGVLQVERLLGEGVHAAYFGAEDYIADLGGRRTRGGAEVLYARSRFVLAARAAGVIPVDQAVVDMRDDDAFRADAARGRDLGFAGKICVHPRQVELAHEVFGAGEAEQIRARALLDAWQRAADQGIGAVEFEGTMIDEPALRMARQALGIDARDALTPGA